MQGRNRRKLNNINLYIRKNILSGRYVVKNTVAMIAIVGLVVVSANVLGVFDKKTTDDGSVGTTKQIEAESASKDNNEQEAKYSNDYTFVLEVEDDVLITSNSVNYIKTIMTGDAVKLTKAEQEKLASTRDVFGLETILSVANDSYNKVTASANEVAEEEISEDPKQEVAKVEAPKQEVPKQETPKQEVQKQGAPKTEAPKAETPKEEVTTEAPAAEPAKKQPSPYTVVQRGAGSFTEEEINMMAAVVYCEAGGEPYEGQLAVANIILNLTYGGYYDGTVKGTLYHKGTFDVVNTQKYKNAVAAGVGGVSRQAVLDAAAGNNNVPGCLQYRPNWYVEKKKMDVNKFSVYYVIGSQTYFNY